MSIVGDALAAFRRVILLEERILRQSQKVEELSRIVIDIDNRLARLEGRIDGFVAGVEVARSRQRLPRPRTDPE